MRGRIHSQNLRRLADRNQFAVWAARRWLESRDVAIASQTADLVGSEAFSSRRLAFLTIQDSGDDFIRIKSGQAAKQRDRVFVRARSHRLEARDRNIQHA